MTRSRLRDYCRLISYVARRRWAQRSEARTPIKLYVPTPPTSLALYLEEEDRYRRERLQRRLDDPTTTHTP